ncbi:LysR family transcriptional regulator [Noviherbaspirillum sp. Root189]|uniref:LysR family transcriptional regulator n=1 Tax=Noviherbaspirillum sp. Root189 TaxID=1736487 RepID=UPI0009EB6486|nr:LysR family transcriptional regulator [Noviherbaspirillum sp. Root189]
MRFNRLDLNLLVALEALLLEKSITRAGRRLNLSQSATSGVLSRLREYFADELLVPVGRSMELTPLALSLIDPVRNVLLQIKATIEIKPAFDPATVFRNFKITASDYVTTVLLSEMACRLPMVAPNIKIEISAPDEIFHEAIERGEIDLIIMPKQYLRGVHPKEVLFTEDYSCVVWTGNTAIGDTLNMETYMSLGHVSTMFGHFSQMSFEEVVLQATGHERRIEVTTDNFTTLPHMVIGTNRIATMHSRLARLFARYYPVRLLPLPFDLPAMEFAMQWNRFFDNDPSHQWLRNLAKQACDAKKDSPSATAIATADSEARISAPETLVT